MKIITKILLLTIIIIFFPLKSFAHVEHYEKVEKFLMEIFKDGKKIGFNNYTFNKNKENLVIENKTEFNVSILGLNAFSIKGASKEVYKNNKLVSFKSDTIQNKKKKFVDLYLDGVRNAGIAGEVDAEGIKESVGGDESYGQMVSWAIDNLPAEDIQAFNKLTDTGDGPAIKLAVQGIYSQYNNAMGIEPNLVSGRASQGGPTPFRSTNEVVTAMSDPRYGKDVTYTEDVQRRLGGSDVFNTGR